MTEYQLCLKCGWVAFGVTREYAETEVKKFNEYYNSLDSEAKSDFGGPSCVERYERCLRCDNHYTNFQKTENCPFGVTLNPIIVEDGEGR